MWQQRTITLRPRSRGVRLMNAELLQALPELAQFRLGQHTSASLTVNENADPAMCRDFERLFNRLVPQDDADTNTTTKARMICRRTSRAACSALRCSGR